MFKSLSMLFCVLSACTTISMKEYENLQSEIEFIRGRVEVLEDFHNHELMAATQFTIQGPGVYIEEVQGFGLHKLESVETNPLVIVTISSRMKYDGTYCLWRIYMWKSASNGMVRLIDQVSIQEGARNFSCRAVERFRNWDFSGGKIHLSSSTSPSINSVNESPIAH